MREIVWLFDENCYGEIIERGAHASLVRYTIDGMIFQILIDNDDFMDRSVIDE